MILVWPKSTRIPVCCQFHRNGFLPPHSLAVVVKNEEPFSILSPLSPLSPPFLSLSCPLGLNPRVFRRGRRKEKQRRGKSENGHGGSIIRCTHWKYCETHRLFGDPSTKLLRSPLTVTTGGGTEYCLSQHPFPHPPPSSRNQSGLCECFPLPLWLTLFPSLLFPTLTKEGEEGKAEK